MASRLRWDLRLLSRAGCQTIEAFPLKTQIGAVGQALKALSNLAPSLAETDSRARVETMRWPLHWNRHCIFRTDGELTQGRRPPVPKLPLLARAGTGLASTTVLIWCLK